MTNKQYSIFGYMYRDYANFKTYNELLLRGIFTEQDMEEKIPRFLWCGEYFIAEQLGILPIHQNLWILSGGKNQDDLPWHTFVEIRHATEEEEQSLPCWGTTKELIDKLSSIDVWDISMSAYAQEVTHKNLNGERMFSLKTLQCSLLGDSQQSFKTLPK